MLFFSDRDTSAKLDALDRSQAVIEFALDGTILTANGNFLSTVGYTLAEIQGQHHRMFVDSAEREGAAYREFWAALARGEFKVAEFKRIAKGGRVIWLQATYNPVLDRARRPCRVVKFASDITDQKLQTLDLQGKFAAIDRSRAVIEFRIDGTILTANRNFLDTVGYELDEVVGQHHSLFVDPAERQSAAYRAFWEALARGAFQKAEFKRFAKGGREIWLQAIYNPILDPDGKPFKVVKFANDVTAEKLRTADILGQIAAINRSQAVIHFDLDGNVLDANENFLAAVGYRLDEIQGKHHRMFVEPDVDDTPEYRQLWESLRTGAYRSDVFKRVGKGGREIWIQASYNPIFDMNGKPFKVVKYATDITAKMAAQISASGASHQTLSSVQNAAAAAEELSASLSEISQNLVQSRAEVEAMHERAQAADQSTVQLNTATASMTGVVQLIQGVGEQINLLALNATIEAARAGEAGRGFAVVAGEVKSLSAQVTKATGRIAEDIQSMQGIATDVISSLTGIAHSITSVREVVSDVTLAVEHQAAATRGISASMQAAAESVSSIDQNLRALVI
ncbi:MAG: PAS domain-containing methyl-accepting chemotaxis protein [Methylobacterium sp.]|uniref:methyl-accepting chemotaxis protein n=1 Tax=Methylobacterium sp. TaxID=409 RepID=UPI00258D5E72|nr:PAS domain-containing methyl-accepting chemotaxis protein [Methylobacterium sp.]MBY0295940.1 PAS domain-containing methyl-accepting chemotaxis protein [Methylobacterium sp.]